MELSQDVIFDILSSRRRRMVLYFLRKEPRTWMVNELAEQVAALENEVDVDDLTDQQQKRVYVSLYQTHLPKLAGSDVIEYDTDAGEVVLTEVATEMDTYLNGTDTESYDWRLHYVGLGILSVVVAVLWALGTPVLASVPPGAIAGTAGAAFLGSAAVQYVRRRNREQAIPAELEH